MVESGSQGARRGCDARRRDVRPEALPAGASTPSSSSPSSGEGAVGAESRHERRRACGKGPRDRRGRSPRGLQDRRPSTSAATAWPRSRRRRLSPLVPEGADAAAIAQGRERLQGAREGRRPRRASSPPSTASTAATSPRCGRSSARSASCRARMAARSSPAARRRRWWWRRSAPARTSNISTRWRAPIRRPSCCTTISRLIRSARSAAWARPGGARSATASSPGARSTRCCRTARASPTPSAWSPRSPSRTARPRWRRCADPRSP